MARSSLVTLSDTEDTSKEIAWLRSYWRRIDPPSWQDFLHHIGRLADVPQPCVDSTIKTWMFGKSRGGKVVEVICDRHDGRGYMLRIQRKVQQLDAAGKPLGLSWGEPPSASASVFYPPPSPPAEASPPDKYVREEPPKHEEGPSAFEIRMSSRLFDLESRVVKLIKEHNESELEMLAELDSRLTDIDRRLIDVNLQLNRLSRVTDKPPAKLPGNTGSESALPPGSKS